MVYLWTKPGFPEIYDDLLDASKDLNLEFAILSANYLEAQITPLRKYELNTLRHCRIVEVFTFHGAEELFGPRVPEFAEIFQTLARGKPVQAPVILTFPETPGYLISGEMALAACRIMEIQPSVIRVATEISS